MPELDSVLQNQTRPALSAISRSAIRQFDQQVSDIPGILKLTLGEPDLNTPEHVKQVLINAITNNASHYAPSAGLLRLRQAVSKYLLNSTNIRYNPASEILITIGATEAIFATMQTILSVTPGVSAHTHSYIQTGQTDSKFGFDIDSGQALKAMRLSQNNPRIHLRGIHAHIGSQIFEVTGFKLEVKKLVNLLTNWSQKYQFTADILNIGGGFGIKYTHADDPLAPELLLGEILDELQVQYSKLGQPIPTIWIEPGRSIVGPAGFSLYTIGSRKDVPGLSPYVAVDGGMGDNIRPALYQADYEAVLAENPNQPPIETVRLAGKFCESGDILINHLPLPTTKTGDVLVMLATGAYGYSMASNYNRNPRPAVVFAENSQAQLVIQRETYADMIQNDLDY